MLGIGSAEAGMHEDSLLRCSGKALAEGDVVRFDFSADRDYHWAGNGEGVVVFLGDKVGIKVKGAHLAPWHFCVPLAVACRGVTKHTPANTSSGA